MSDRSRDRSDALTEVRTVLSRAETAMETLLWHSYRGNLPDLGWNRRTHRWEPTGSLAAPGDPDAEDMYYALERVAHELHRWRKAGKRKSR